MSKNYPLQILFNQQSTNGFTQQNLVNPNLFSNLNILLTKYGLNPQINPKVNVYNDAKNQRYWELLYQDSDSKIYYDYISTLNSIQNTDSNNYIVIQEPYVSNIVYNDKRFVYYSSSYIINVDVSSVLFPQTKYISFKALPSEVSPLNLTATLQSLGTQPYTENIVTRYSCFVFEPSSNVFLLIHQPGDKSTKKIYAMQTWSNKVYPPLDSETNMFNLQTILSDPEIVGENVLPEKWVFASCLLDEVFMIALFSNPDMDINAVVLGDALGNSYQYIRYEEAPFLYDL